MEHVDTTSERGRLCDRWRMVRIGATITTHHLMINRNHLLVGAPPRHYMPARRQTRKSPAKLWSKPATIRHPRFFPRHRSAPAY